MAGEEAAEPRYWAFISYSHADKQWGDWLHHSLETYRVPKRLVGKPSRDGHVPKRVFPVFRDREELPGSSNLGDNITSALAASRYLIVICSPRSAASRWVNEEIKTFKAMGREDRVLCLIVDGEPNATSKPELGLLECFPEAVRFRVGPDRQVTDEPTEPIAADARPGKDGKANARLKLLSGVLGVAYDELKQRDRQRRIRQRIQIAAAAVLLVALLGGVFVFKELQRRSEQRKALAEAHFASGLKALDRGESAFALAWFASALRHDPSNQLLVSRATSLLVQRRWVMPAGPPLPHGGPVVAAEWSPDDRRIATASSDGFIRVWDAETAQPLTNPLPQPQANAVTWSSDGTQLISSGEPEALVWDATTGKQVGSGLGFIGGARQAQFSRDGSAILTASADGTVGIWDAQSKQRRVTLPHPGPVFFASWSPDGKRVLTASLDETARLWDAGSGLPVAPPIKLKGFPFAGEYTPDGRRFVTASDNVAEVWDAITGEAVFRVQHETGVLAARFSPDGKLLLTGSLDQTGRFWDSATGTAVGAPLQHGEAVQFASFNRSSDRALTATSEGNAQVWDVANGRRITEAFRQRDALLSASFDGSGKRILTASKDHTAQIWRLMPGTSSPVVLAAGDWITSATFENGGNEVQTVSRNGATNVWDAASGRLLRSSNTEAPFAAVSADRSRRALLDERNMSITVVDAASGKPVRAPITAPSPVMAAALSPDGQRFCAGLYDSAVHCWDVASGALLFEPIKHPQFVRGVSFSFDGRRIATACADRGVRIWDAATGQSTAEPLWHEVPVQDVQFAPDGTRLAVATTDGKALLWSTARPVPVAEPFVHDKPYVRAAHFSPDGRRLLTVTSQTAYVWDTVLLSEPAPPWLPEAIEAIGGLRLGNNDLPEPVQDRWKRMTELRAAVADVNDRFGQWAKWLLATGDQRTISPFSTVVANPPQPMAAPPLAAPPEYQTSISPAAQRRILLTAWLQHGSFWSATLRESYGSGTKEAEEYARIPQRSFEEATRIATDLVAAAPDDAQHQRDLSEASAMLAGAHLYGRQVDKGLAVALEAVAAAQKAAQLLPDDPESRAAAAQAFGNLAGLQLYNRQPGEAVTSAMKGLEHDPQQTWIKVNLAHGYLLNGEYEKAEPIYRENKEAELPGLKEKTFGQLALKTLDELKNHGVEHPDMQKAVALLQTHPQR